MSSSVPLMVTREYVEAAALGIAASLRTEPATVMSVLSRPFGRDVPANSMIFVEQRGGFVQHPVR